MSIVNPLSLVLVQGKRFQKVFRWGTPVKIYKAISAVPQKTPARLTVTGHGMPDGWPFRVTGVRGPGVLNSVWHTALVIDANTIEINAANIGDQADYAGGGFIEYYTPVDLAGVTNGIIVFKEAATDTSPVLEATQANSRLLLDNVLKTITLDIAGSVSAPLAKYAGVWDWEMTIGGSVYDPRGPLLALPPWRMTRELAT